MFWHNGCLLLLSHTCTLLPCDWSTQISPVFQLLSWKAGLFMLGRDFYFLISFQEFPFLWCCSSCSSNWEGTVSLMWLIASRTPSQGRFVFHGCFGLGCFSVLQQRWLKGQKEKERNKDPGKAEVQQWKSILAPQMYCGWTRQKSNSLPRKVPGAQGRWQQQQGGKPRGRCHTCLSQWSCLHFAGSLLESCPPVTIGASKIKIRL